MWKQERALLLAWLVLFIFSPLRAQLLETAAGLAIGQLVAERATLVMRLAEAEDWAIVAASHRTGAPRAPSQLMVGIRA